MRRVHPPRTTVESRGADKIDALITRGVLAVADLRAWEQRDLRRFIERYHQEQQARRRQPRAA
jgi:hypothetical protein